MMNILPAVAVAGSAVLRDRTPAVKSTEGRRRSSLRCSGPKLGSPEAGISRHLNSRFNVLVQSEKVGRIELRLDPGEASVFFGAIGPERDVPA